MHLNVSWLFLWTQKTLIYRSSMTSPQIILSWSYLIRQILFQLFVILKKRYNEISCFFEEFSLILKCRYVPIYITFIFIVVPANADKQFVDFLYYFHFGLHEVVILFISILLLKVHCYSTEIPDFLNLTNYFWRVDVR